MNYAEKLLDPRWQKKRLSILNREGFKCQCCRSDNNTLHVHHLIYTAKDPWDEPDENLECLCASCHEWRESFNQFTGGKTAMPTVVCFLFCRFASADIYKAGSKHLPIVRFNHYLSYTAPEQVPEAWRPSKDNP